MSESTPGNERRSREAVNDTSPWPGLLAYGEADRKYFHGRRSESEQLFRRVMRESLTILFGLSGLGKSSLIQAGVFPLLRRQRILPIYIRLDFSSSPPDLTSQALTAVTEAAAAAGAEAPPLDENDSLWAFFHRREADFWSRRNRLLMPLLVFDQFEELFTLGRADSARVDASDHFVGQLGDLIEGRPPADLKHHLDRHPQDAAAYAFSRHHYKVLISLRDDFLADLEGLLPVIPAIARNRMRLERMNGRAALEVVAHARHLIDSEVAEQVVRFVASQAPDLPLETLELEPALLSVLCRELNLRRMQRGDPRITRNLFQGSQEEILRGFYERSLEDLGPAVRALVEDRLLTVSGFRDSMALENALNLEGVTREEIDRLVDRRLIRREDRSGVQRIELTHDILTRVIADSRKERREREAEKERQAALQSYQAEIKEQERVQRLEERARSARRLRRLLAAAVALFIIAAAMGGLAWFQGNIAKRESRKANAAMELAKEKSVMAEKEKITALGARSAAEEQRDLADTRLQRITDGIALRQAALSGEIDTDRWAKYIDKSISFLGRAKPMGYKNSRGDPIYRFEVYPDIATVEGGFEAIAFITYRMGHETFQNKLLTAGPDTHFLSSYTGWGCLSSVIALIEYDTVERDPSLVIFDMCGIIDF